MTDLEKYYRENETDDTGLVVAWAEAGRYGASCRQDTKGFFWLIYPADDGPFFETVDEILSNFHGQMPTGKDTIEIYQAGTRKNGS